ncbi:Cytochrome c family protein [hydrothermal vent metagenome]|uniref:Cytochrome c family protein n=1 Tax=hydrothermal vent metagenome TaxID=652676 RepID=A0A3B1ADH0_9ZZZZ
MDITKTIRLIAGFGVLIFAGGVLADGWAPGSRASETGSIVETRHNLTFSYNEVAAGSGVMNFALNEYGSVCVYCHTPHGANSQIDAPLWNRTINSGSYEIYDKPTTLMRPMSAPGPTSLTCLSCHDGTIAIDSILNMPGSGRSPSGLVNGETSANLSFLDDWANNPLPDRLGAALGNHAVMGTDIALGNCTQCHNRDFETSSMNDFQVFTIGTDLRDDHPVGVLYPDEAGVDGGFFNAPTVELPGSMAFFDTNGNNRADPDEVRLYDSGEGYEVECASCHDPHGVPSGGSGTNTRFSPSFLRVNNGIGEGMDYDNDGIVGSTRGVDGIVSNGPSALCLTCHTK